MANDYRKDIKATFLNSIFKVFAGPILLIFIPLFLTPVEQGYWYTFTGLATLAVFADLGFSTIVLQFAAHEFAYLNFDCNNRIVGSNEHLGRLSNFFVFSLKWVFKMTMVIFPLIMIGGYYFLVGKDGMVRWEYPWLIYSFFSAGTFINSIILNFFEGCNSVKMVQLVRLKMVTCSTVVTLIALGFDCDLYALALSMLATFITSSYFIYKTFFIPMKQLLLISKNYSYDWGKEFFPLLWRYAISWCSGYFIFQTFVPIAFYFHGAEYSGKLGISIAMWMAGFNIAMSWINAILPRINNLIALHKWKELDKLFFKSLFRSLITMAIGGGVFLFLYYLFNDDFFLFRRILSLNEMIILFICWIGQVYINSVAIYLRSHKEEPLMNISVVVSIYVVATTLVCAHMFSYQYMLIGFLSSLLFWVPTVYKILKRTKDRHVSFLEACDE